MQEDSAASGFLPVQHLGSDSETKARELWKAFARTHTSYLADVEPSSTSLSRSQTYAVLSTHLDALREVQSTLGQRMNWLTPIYQLPDEILMHIFVYVCAARTPNASPPIDLMTVCRRWQNVVNSFPGVWAYPRLYTSGAKMNALLQRSKSAALHLCWTAYGLFTPEFDSADMPAGESVLSPLVARSRSITLEATSPVLREVMNQFGSSNVASLLESLEILVDPSHPAQPHTQRTRMTPAIWPQQVFDTPQLRRLKLTNFSYFDWSHSLLCSTLTALEVSFYDGPSVFGHAGNIPEAAECAPCTYERLLDALERLHCLEELSLLRCASTSLFLGTGSKAVDRCRKVVMKRLQTLRVFDHSQACAVLHHNLSLPEDTVALYMFDGTEQADIDNMATLVACSPSIKEQSSVRICLLSRHSREGRCVLFNFYNENMIGRVAVSALIPALSGANGQPAADGQYHEVCAAMATALLPLTNVRYIDVEVDEIIPPLPRSIWLRSLSCAHYVERLAVEARLVPMLSSALRRRLMPGDDTPFLFPHLEEITMHGGSLHELEILTWTSYERGSHSFDIFHDQMDSRIVGPVVCVHPDGTRTRVRIYSSNDRYKPRINAGSATQALQKRARKKIC